MVRLPRHRPEEHGRWYLPRRTEEHTFLRFRSFRQAQAWQIQESPIILSGNRLPQQTGSVHVQGRFSNCQNAPSAASVPSRARSRSNTAPMSPWMQMARLRISSGAQAASRLMQA